MKNKKVLLVVGAVSVAILAAYFISKKMKSSSMDEVSDANGSDEDEMNLFGSRRRKNMPKVSKFGRRTDATNAILAASLRSGKLTVPTQNLSREQLLEIVKNIESNNKKRVFGQASSIGMINAALRSGKLTVPTKNLTEEQVASAISTIQSTMFNNRTSGTN